MKCLSLVRVVLFGGVLFSTALAWGQTENLRQEPYIHAFSGKRPFTIVYPSNGGDGERTQFTEEGIYTPARTNNVELAVPGKILMSSVVRGVIAELGIHQVDSRFPAIAISDGYLTLFTINSRAKKLDSYIRIGSERTPIIDPLTGLPIYLAPIQSLDEVAVLAQASSSASQVVLFSVKGQGGSGGKGITFAISMESGKYNQAGIRLSQPPVLLDNVFRNEQTLAHLIPNQSAVSQIYSPQHLRNLSVSRPKDSATLAKFRADISVQVERLTKGLPVQASTGTRSVNVPTYSLNSGLLRFPVRILDTYPAGPNGNWNIYHLYEPETGGGKIVHFPGGSTGNPSVLLPTLADTAKNKIGYHIYPQEHGSVYMLMAIVESQMHIIMRGDGNQVGVIPIGNHGVPVQNVSLIGFKVTDKDDPRQPAAKFIAILSYQLNASKAVTEAFEISQFGGNFVADRRIPISKTFLTSEQILQRYESGSVVFDNVTKPIAKNAKAQYEDVVSETTPRLDLLASLRLGQPRQTYLKYLDEREINQYFKYIIADPTGAVVNQSGLQMKLGEKVLTKINGELLIAGAKKDSERAKTQTVIAQITAEIKKERSMMSADSYEFFVAALDPSFEGGKTSFNLILGGNRTDLHSIPIEGELAVQPFYFLERINRPLSEVKDFILMNGIGNRANEIYVFMVIDGKKADDKGVYLKRFQVTQAPLAPGDFRTQANFTTPSGEWKEVAKGAVSSGEVISERLKIDQHGKFFWVVDTKISDQDSRYRLKDLDTFLDLTKSEVFAENLQMKNVRDIESMKEFSNKFVYSKWAMTYRGKVEDFAKSFATIDLDKYVVPAPSNQFQDEIFPGLPGYLDDLVDARRPNANLLLLVSEADQVAIGHRIAKHLTDDENFPVRRFSSKSNEAVFYCVTNDKLSQNDVLETLEDMREKAESGKRVVMVVPLALMQNNFRPAPSGYFGKPFTITADEEQETESRLTPNLLYMIRAAGQRLSPSELKPRIKAELSGSAQPPFTTLLVGTETNYNTLVDALEKSEKEAGILKGIVKDTRYLNNPWKMWSNHGLRTHPTLLSVKKLNVSPFEEKVFPTLFKTLEDLADVQQEPKHQLLVVPKELKDRVVRMMYWRWMRGEEKAIWSHRNQNLIASKFDGKTYTRSKPGATDSADVLWHEAMGAAIRSISEPPPGARSLVVGTLSEILDAGRPTRSDGGKYTRTSYNLLLQKTNPDGTTEESEIAPHALYMLANEGIARNLVDFEIADKTPKTSMLFIATEEEIKRAREDIGYVEGGYGLLEHFEEIHLQVPSFETREKVLTDLFLQSFPQYDFRFSAKGIVENAEKLSNEEARSEVVRFLVSRTESLAAAAGKGLEPTFAYTQFLNSLMNTLRDDPDFKKTVVRIPGSEKPQFQIDKSFADRFVYPKVFKMALDVELLPKGDPLTVLSNKKAPLIMQENGYEGPPDLRKKIIMNLLAQTQSSDKPIPSSLIVYGDSSTGKSFMFEVLVRMLNLQIYDYRVGADNVNAQAMIINAGKILERNAGSSNNKNDDDDDDSKKNSPKQRSDANSSDTLTFEQVKKAVDDFLMKPKGYRGYILFDDLHKASESVRLQLVTLINSLFEARDGLYQASGGSIPVRNLTLFMTLNPTDDLEKLARFVPKDASAGEKLITNILASIAGKNNDGIERSFIERWGSILDLSQFPISAKAPKLMSSLKGPAKEAFTNHGRFTLFSTGAVEKVARKFGGVNARAFGASAPPAFMSLASRGFDSGGNGQSKGHIVIAVPKRDRFHVPDADAEAERWKSQSGSLAQAAISAFIQDEMSTLSVSADLEGKLEFLKILVSSFRAQMYFSMVKYVQDHPSFDGNQMLRETVQPYFLRALVNHLTERPELDLSLIDVNPRVLGVTSPALGEKMIGLAKATSMAEYFPFTFRSPIDANVGSASAAERTRRGVILGASGNVESKALLFLNEMLRVDSIVENPPEPKEWLLSLSPKEDGNLAQKMGVELFDELLSMNRELSAYDLKENMSQDKFPKTELYAEYRYFFYALDRAIARLPWAHSAQLVINGIETAAKQLALAQHPGALHYFYKSRTSILNQISLETIMSYAMSTETFEKSLVSDLMPTHEANFRTKCKEYFDGFAEI
jgi:hypothetical protein